MITTNHGEKSTRSAAIDCVRKYYKTQGDGHDPYAHTCRGYEQDGWYGVFKAIAEAAEKSSGKLYY